MVMQYKETRYDMEKRQSVAVADWVFGENLDGDKIIIGKSEPDSMAWDFRLFKVDDCSGYVYDLKKTKINIWNEENPAEEKLAERIIDLAVKTTEWRHIVSVEDKDDYMDFVKWYKNAKRMLKNCAKYGF